MEDTLSVGRVGIVQIWAIFQAAHGEVVLEVEGRTGRDAHPDNVVVEHEVCSRAVLRAVEVVEGAGGVYSEIGRRALRLAAVGQVEGEQAVRASWSAEVGGEHQEMHGINRAFQSAALADRVGNGGNSAVDGRKALPHVLIGKGVVGAEEDAGLEGEVCEVVWIEGTGFETVPGGVVVVEEGLSRTGGDACHVVPVGVIGALFDAGIVGGLGEVSVGAE